MSAKSLKWALYEAPGTRPSERLLLAFLGDAGADGREEPERWVSLDSLMAWSGMSMTRLEARMTKLEQDGLVEIYVSPASERSYARIAEAAA